MSDRQRTIALSPHGRPQNAQKRPTVRVAGVGATKGHPHLPLLTTRLCGPFTGRDRRLTHE